MATLTELAAEIVSSHASTTTLTTDELLQEIQKVYSALQALEIGNEAVIAAEELKPSISIKEAFKKNEVICMICGRGGMKTLARHLSQAHNIKPGEYKRQFGIPAKQPLTAKSFSDARKKFAEERDLAGNLTKARETRMAKIAARKAPKAPQKAVQTKTARAKAVKTEVPKVEAPAVPVLRVVRKKKTESK